MARRGKIRQGLLEEGLFDAVIGFAPNIFYGTGVPASNLVLNRDKPVAHGGKVLFIDASEEFDEESNQNCARGSAMSRRRRMRCWCAVAGR